MKAVCKEDIKPDWPKLMQGDSGIVVLMSSSRLGTVVYTPSDDWSLGYHSIHWNMAHFQPYTGTLELSND